VVAAQPEGRPQAICQLCVETVGVSGGGISMVTQHGNRGVVCATDDVAEQIEDLQLTLGQGPCVDAVQSGMPVLIPDLSQPEDLAVERWGTFIGTAASLGVRAVFAFPLRIGAISVGALDLYRDTPGMLTDQELPAALLTADAAALALLQLGDSRGDRFADDEDARSSYRLHVHQATGMVQVQLGVTIEDAFLALRARAFADGRPLVDVATDVIERRLRFSMEDR
jgi:GAF domain-containing protein